MSCIYEQIKEFLKVDIPYSIEQGVRQCMGVTSLPVGSREARLAVEQTLHPVPLKKGEKKPVDLNYHANYDVFTKMVDQINTTANVKSTNSSFGDTLKLVSQPMSTQNTQNSPLLKDKKAGLNSNKLECLQCDMSHSKDYF